MLTTTILDIFFSIIKERYSSFFKVASSPSAAIQRQALKSSILCFQNKSSSHLLFMLLRKGKELLACHGEKFCLAQKQQFKHVKGLYLNKKILDTFAKFNFKIPSSKKTLILVASGSIPHFSFLIRVHIFPLIFHFPLFKLQRENGSFTAACLSARETFMSVEAHKILNWIFASKHISILDMCCTTAVCWDYAKPIFISLQKFPSKRNIKT